MKRFTQKLAEANQALNDLLVDYTFAAKELERVNAENARLRYMAFRNQSRERERWGRVSDKELDRLFRIAEQAIEHRNVSRELHTKHGEYFDVTRWEWVPHAVIPYRVKG